MAAASDHGLKGIVWQKLKDTIIADCKKADIWKILILDPFTTKLLSSCCKMSDLMAEGITIVEDLYKNREPVPEMKAIYFMSPTSKCVDAFIADFKLKPKYKAAYVYFTDYCSDDLFNKMKLYCAKYIRVVKEINLSFLPLEAQVFTFDNPEAFRSIYSPHSQDKRKTMETLADQIVTLCATLGEYPGVRYKKESNTENTMALAALVDNKLAAHYELDDSGNKKEKTQAQLLIVERGFDPVSPILHELTYQAMAYDLVDIKKETYKYKSKDGSEKEALLNEEDMLWVKLRHMHIAEVTAQIPKLVKEISANKKQPDDKITISGLSQLMKKMPSFRKQMAQKTVHLHLAEDCMSQYQKNVEKLCKAEQDLAVGSDVEGVKVKDPMRTLLPVLLNNHSTHDKIRAVLLYIFSLNGTTEENLNKLIQHVKIENEREFILNWKELGVSIISSPSLFSRKPSRRDRSEEETYNLSRWTPVIKDVMEDAIENKLDTKEWPHQSESPATWNGSGAVSARQKHKPSSQDERRSGARLIVFVIGGVCYSETRCAYQVTQAVKSCQVIIGSSHIVTPTGLLEDIKALSKGPMETFTIKIPPSEMLSDCGGRGAAEALDQGRRPRTWTSPMRGDMRQGYGTQEWPDGSKYEGDYLNGLKHGKGRFTWKNGEVRDYRHGEGFYSWPSGHKFTGKFYLNKKEGYGMKEFPDGSTFQGLYHAHQKFGPGVLTYPDGRQDVGLWHRDHLARLCTSLEGGFSLSSFPEYATYMGPAAAAIDPLATWEHDPLRSPYTDLLSEESLTRPPGLEFYSSDGDHLPLPPGFRKELDRCFFGELWEPELDRDPVLVSTLPWQLRMQAHIHRHRLEIVRVGWDVSAVLSLSRKPFGPKGPLEFNSEMLIQKASMGDQQAVNRILRTRLVSPNVSDARGHTPLIAATVNCHDAVIHLLLDMGADIDNLNCEGMNALAVCHVLYYPFQSLHTTVAERAVATPRPRPAGSPLSGPAAEVGTNQQHGNADDGVDSDGCPRASVNETEGGEEEVRGEVRCLEVLDGHIPLGGVTWRGGGAGATRKVASAASARVQSELPVFSSSRSLDSFFIPVTEEGMQRAAETLSRIGVPHRTHSQETVRKMAAMKIEHRARWSTLRLLLQRGADPNTSRVPMPVLFLAIKAAHVEAVLVLLQCGARTDKPLPSEWKGLYPLHIAAGLPGPEGPRITELLLHAITDPDAQAQDQEDVYQLDKTRTEPQTALGNKTLASTSWGPNFRSPSSEAPAGGGRTALHVACQRDSDYSNASEVVSLLLSHRASTHLLWSGHSPLSLAIASGNDMAVEVLLKGGADPNLPLSRRVGSALCALSNIHYDSTGHPHNRAKLLDTLVKAGADILMPVLVGDGQRSAFGTAVDYAHYTFNQDPRIAHTCYHALSQREKERYQARCHLLRMMGDLLRQAAGCTEREERSLPSSQYCQTRRSGGSETGGAEESHSMFVCVSSRTPLRSCYQCGRSAFVTLTPCSRCHQVVYCSTNCKLKAWEQRHRDECIRLPESTSSSQQSERFKSSRIPRPLSTLEKVAEVHIDPTENYSFI
ncbi:unnamed protein product [Lota lota]